MLVQANNFEACREDTWRFWDFHSNKSSVEKKKTIANVSFSDYLGDYLIINNYQCQLRTLPGQCGMLWMYNMAGKFENCDEKLCEIARVFGYSAIGCTRMESSEHPNWETIYEFINQRTNHRVYTMIRQISQ